MGLGSTLRAHLVVCGSSPGWLSRTDGPVAPGVLRRSSRFVPPLASREQVVAVLRPLASGEDGAPDLDPG